MKKLNSIFFKSLRSTLENIIFLGNVIIHWTYANKAERLVSDVSEKNANKNAKSIIKEGLNKPSFIYIRDIF